MSFGDQSFASPYGAIADQSAAAERADFIRKTYSHLLVAVMTFALLEWAFITGGVAEWMMSQLGGMGRLAPIVFLGGFLLVSWVANSWANNAANIGMQYAGLGLYVLAQSVIFAPILWYASNLADGTVLPSAAVTTLLLFGGLTAYVFISGANFNWLGGLLWMGTLGLIGVAICGYFFGFDLGMVFTVAGIGLACGWILYDTSNVLHTYRIGQHVAASLALFASLAMLFWYILRFYLDRD